MKKPGTLVISLDFELMWGMFDKVTLENYGDNLKGVHDVVPKILALFEKYGIHATWATVGMLMYPSKSALAHNLPNPQPKYKDQKLSSCLLLQRGHFADRDEHYFAPELVEQIISTPGQELASHTFSHYYCLERQRSGEREAFAADCDAMSVAAQRFNKTLSSIVFPRNQWNTAALTICKEKGLAAFRGTESHFLYRPRTEKHKSNIVLRALRFLDRYINISGHHTYARLDAVEGLINIPASRQLAPYNTKLQLLEPDRRKRIKKSMTRAAKCGEIYHLWWHPHNFGVNQTENLESLENLLQHFVALKVDHGMQSMTMRELAIHETGHAV